MPCVYRLQKLQLAITASVSCWEFKLISGCSQRSRNVRRNKRKWAGAAWWRCRRRFNWKEWISASRLSVGSHCNTQGWHTDLNNSFMAESKNIEMDANDSKRSINESKSSQPLWVGRGGHINTHKQACHMFVVLLLRWRSLLLVWSAHCNLQALNVTLRSQLSSPATHSGPRGWVELVPHSASLAKAHCSALCSSEPPPARSLPRPRQQTTPTVNIWG